MPQKTWMQKGPTVAGPLQDGLGYVPPILGIAGMRLECFERVIRERPL
jgi:hypothetical protein